MSVIKNINLQNVPPTFCKFMWTSPLNVLSLITEKSRMPPPHAAAAVVWRLLSMLSIFPKGGGGGAVAHWRGDDNARVFASVRCCWRRGEDATINIRWEVRGGRVTKGKSRWWL